MNERPKIKIEKSIIDKIIELATFLLIIGTAVLLGFYYNQLPEKVEINFNWPSKDNNGFGVKDLLWISPVICGIICLALYKLNNYPWIFNYPVKITTENAKENYKNSTQMLRAMSLIISLLCLLITLSSVLSGLGKTFILEKYLFPIFPVLLIGIPIVYMIKINRSKKKSKETI